MILHCNKCNQDKQDTEFYDSNASVCKKCKIDWQRQYRINNPDKDAEIRRREVYTKLGKQIGMELFEVKTWYERKFEEQKGCCAICGRNVSELFPDGRNMNLNIDHNHQTLKLRGLLCNNCNLAVGNLQDSPELCFAAGEYLISQQ